MNGKKLAKVQKTKGMANQWTVVFFMCQKNQKDQKQ